VTSAETEGTLGFERIVFFSDAVFAIVITLLVLPLTAEMDLPEGGGGVAAHVWEMRRSVLTFAATFLVVGQFWTAHHGIYGRIRRFDAGLVSLNLWVLLTVAFLPFPAAVLGRRLGDEVFPVVFYACSMTLVSAMLTLTWLYAVRRGLIAGDVPAQERRGVSLRSAVTTGLFVLSIPVALLGLVPAAVMWLVVLPAARTLVSRWTAPSG